MLRKIAIWLLLIPMPLNGLWVTCQDADSKAPKQDQATQAAADDNTNLLAMFASGAVDVDDSPACTKICARDGRSGGFCLLSGESRNSFSIVVFGVALLPPAVALHSLPPTAQIATELTNGYSNPSADGYTPPPRA
jgi:hypothetical protein